MAQGSSKLKSKAKARVTKKQTNPRAAAKLIIKPKKDAAKKALKLKKLVEATNGTEALVASRVGHLELLKGSRREAERAGKLGKAGKAGQK